MTPPPYCQVDEKVPRVKESPPDSEENTRTITISGKAYRELEAAARANGMPVKTYIEDIVEKRSAMISDTFRNISRILEHDKANTTYKYSLIKSVIESCQDYPLYADIDEENNRVTLPLGLCVMKWLIYYYPFFLPEPFIAMQQGEKEDGNKSITFRKYFGPVCSYYEEHEGNSGLSVFATDLIHGTVPEKISQGVVDLAREIRKAIVDGPIKHFGNSDSNKLNSVFRKESRAKGLKTPLSLRQLIDCCGTYSIPKDFYLVFRGLGGFILGDSSAHQKWLEFLLHENAGQKVSKEEILQRFAMVPVSERVVKPAREVYLKEIEAGRCFCFWSGKHLTKGNLDVDHLFPFAVLRSNDLWNLVPAEQSVNRKKSDKVPPVEFLLQRKDLVFTCWGLLYAAHPQQFEEEISMSLFRGGHLSENWMEEAFERICEKSKYLIEVRGCEEYKIGDNESKTQETA